MSQINLEIDKKEYEKLKEKFDKSNFEKIIDEAVRMSAYRLEQDILNEMDEKGINDTGRMAQSLFVRKITDGTYQLGFGVRYAYNIEYGSKPFSPRYDSILEWVKRKLGYSGKEGSTIAWKIRATIRKKGIRPRSFVKEAIERGNYVKDFNQYIKLWTNDEE